MFVFRGRFFASRRRDPVRLPNFVHDVRAARCVFCPYGTKVKAGDRVLAWDDRTAFDHTPRERLVEVTDVKTFRSNGRVVTLDMGVTDDAELARIAEDSEVSVDALFNHRAGQPTYDAERPPVVVYFRGCEPAGEMEQRTPGLYVVARADTPPRASDNQQDRPGLRMRSRV